jgi:drug/metabolite transporter (DMT)-like permease
MFAVILLFALFASLFTLSKSALELASPYFLIGSRMAVAGLLLIVHQWIFHRPVLKRSYILPLFFLGVCNIFICNIAEIYGISQMSSAKACLLYSLSPFVSALFAYWALGETLDFYKWLGLLFGFFGLLPIALIHNDVIGTQAVQWLHFSWPEIAMLLAVFSSVYGWILLKKILIETPLTPLWANGVSMLIGGLLALLYSYTMGEPWNPWPVQANAGLHFIEISLVMLLISNVICYNLYGYLLKRYSATFMSLAGLVTPLFASFFGWYFLQEHLSWHFYLSVTLFSIGLGLFYREELHNKPSRNAGVNIR